MGQQGLTEHGREEAQADLLRFTALNALSFEVLAGQILILFARQVGASLSDIGLLSALLPFAAVIQLGVAPLVNRFGPRALMLAGWAARTVVAAALFLVPLAARSGQAAATRVLLWIMAAFYLCRALGMSSWLPMVQEIVPPQDRGVFLSRQEWLRQVSIVLIAVVTAVYLLGATGLTRFLHIIAVGVAAAGLSLYFLWRVPDVGGMAEPLDREYVRRAMAPMRDGVFRRYLFFSVMLRMVLTAFPPFLVVFLKEGLGFSPSGVIVVNTVGSLGAIATLAAWGRWTDRVGARPALGICIAGVASSLLLWTLARQEPQWSWLGVPAISLVLGLFTGGLTVSMSKFELGFIPVRGRAHYVALNVTAVGLGSGAATLGAGRLLTALSGKHVRLGTLTMDRFEVFFFLSALLLVVPLLVRATLPEERARSLRDILRREMRLRSLRMLRMLRRPAA
jgi:MFS family permease